jgi:rhomboid protease GluP
MPQQIRNQAACRLLTRDHFLLSLFSNYRMLTPMKEKIRLIFLPFLTTLIGLTVCYTFLHWLLFIQWEVFAVKDVILNFGIPIGLACLAAYFYLRPKFKMLSLQTKKGSWIDLYTFICAS